jgi:hypothetical protein
VFNISLVKQCIVFKGQISAVFVTVLSIFVFSLPAQAIEIGGSGHIGTENETQGYSLFIANKFSRKSHFHWSLGVSRLEKVSVEWNSDILELPINVAEASLSYRYQFSSRSPVARRFSMEYQLGMAVSLTENKFFWTDPIEEKFFSQSGDVNGFLAVSAHYKMSSNVSAIIGVKHFPELSEFGDISSVFLGFKFNLDFGSTYYGN